MNAVKREIEAIKPATLVKLLQYDGKFRDEVLTFKPHVMMTFPMTSTGLAAPYYVFKYLFGTKVVCFRAEGIIDANAPQAVTDQVGYDHYGPKLVDYEIFWGPGLAKIVGNALVERKKISAPERIKCFGYPRLERYFGVKPAEGAARLPTEAVAKLTEFGRERTILIITGFHFANYTREMIFAARDLDAENRCDELLGVIAEVKNYRAHWIEQVKRAAAENPDLLFVLKKHPIERKQDYSELEGINNVLYVWQDIDIADVMERTGLFIHYGSTSLADAYLAGVPAVYVYSQDTRLRRWFPHMGWPSARSVPCDQITEVIREFRTGTIKHDGRAPAVREVLEFNFNIRDGEAYRPSRQIAEFLLRDDEAQRISASDPYFWRALLRHYYLRLVRRPIKKVLQAALRQQ